MVEQEQREHSCMDQATMTGQSQDGFSMEREPPHSSPLLRTLAWVGVAGLSAALAYTVVRTVVLRRPADPTSQRIQQLIDEANQLLKTLDDKKHSG